MCHPWCDRTIAAMASEPWLKWIYLTWIGSGLVRLVQYIRRVRRIAVDPDRSDPLRRVWLLLLGSIPVLLFALVLVNETVSKHFSPTTLFVISANIIAVFILAGALLYGADKTEAKRREAGYVYSAISYKDAPITVKKSMWRISRRARSIRRGQAFQRHLIDRTELQRLVYSAAHQAVISSELCSVIDDLSPTNDRELVSDAWERIEEIEQQLKNVEVRLATATKSADGISAAITQPERESAREREQALAQAAKEEQQRQARATLAEVTLRAKGRPVNDGSDLEEHITALHAGYQEVTDLSNHVLQGRIPQPPENHVQTPKQRGGGVEPPHRSGRRQAWKAAKSTASLAARASAKSYKAARQASEEMRKRRD